MLTDHSIVLTRPPGRVFAASHRQSGYTATELVVVMVVLGVLAASTLPRFFSASGFDEMGYTDSVVSAMRYAQKLAIASRCDTRVSLDSSGYALFQRATDCGTGNLTRIVNRPGGGAWAGTTPAGLSVGTLDVYFDAWGRPHDAASGSLLGSVQTINVGSRTVTLQPTSGYVQAG